MDYIAYLHKDQGSDFGVSFPDFPGCITAGKSLEEARQMAAEALAFHVAGLLEDGEAIPEPSNLDELSEDQSLKDAVAFLVHLEPQTSRTVRINITARENQVEQIDQLAASAGMTRSAYMVQTALNNTTRRVEREKHTAKRERQRVDFMAAHAEPSYGKRHSRPAPSTHSSRRKKKA
jgi:predicted RNase H-like HicB family nuclease/uncharacterized protein (DUF1778 family)